MMPHAVDPLEHQVLLGKMSVRCLVNYYLEGFKLRSENGKVVHIFIS